MDPSLHIEEVVEGAGLGLARFDFAAARAFSKQALPVVSLDFKVVVPGLVPGMAKFDDIVTVGTFLRLAMLEDFGTFSKSALTALRLRSCILDGFSGLLIGPSAALGCVKEY